MTVLGRDLLPKVGAALGLDVHEIGGITIDIPFDDFVMVHVKFLANKEHAEQLVRVLTDEHATLHEPLETEAERHLRQTQEVAITASAGD